PESEREQLQLWNRECRSDGRTRRLRSALDPIAMRDGQRFGTRRGHTRRVHGPGSHEPGDSADSRHATAATHRGRTMSQRLTIAIIVATVCVEAGAAANGGHQYIAR